MKAYRKITLIILVIIPALCQNFVHAQETNDSVTEITPSLNFTYLCTSNDSVILTSNLSVRRDQGSFYLQNAEIEFIAMAGESKKSLGKAKTDSEGNAIVKFPVKAGLPRDKNGITNYTATFSGEGNYQPVEETLSAKLAKIVVNFSKEDSIRYIDLAVFSIEADGVLKPIPETMVNIYVPRLFNNLKIGEVTLDSEGKGRLEYPVSLIGDSLGYITVIGKIEENETYNTVQGQSTINWAISKFFYTAERPTRELWTPVAPVWMIVTLIIMLTGVWAHYIYAVVQMIMIKRHDKEKKNYS